MKKFSASTIIVALIATMMSSTSFFCDAFVVRHTIITLTSSSASTTTTRTLQQQRVRSRISSSSSNNDNNSADTDVEALRAAAARAREDAERLSRELGKTSASSTSTVPAKKTTAELQAMLPSLLANNNWSALKEASKIFGSANLKTFAVSLQMLEQRTGLSAAVFSLEDDVNLDDFKYATLYVLAFSGIGGVAALALLPPNVGATVCYFLAILPVLFLGVGSTAPGLIAGAIKTVKEGKSAETVNASERTLRHEAAHFCCGYWCGLPIQDYDLSSDNPRVEFSVDDGSGSSGYASGTVAALAVTGLAGLVGEAMEYGNAQGASQDLMVLDGIFRRAKDFYGAQQQQDLTRWAAFTASQLLNTNKDKYESVVKAFTRQAPLEECITILES